MNKRGQTGIIVVVLGIVIGMILIMSVLIPVTKASITTANFTTGSTDANIASTLTTLILVGALVLVASLAYFAFRK